MATRAPMRPTILKNTQLRNIGRIGRIGIGQHRHQAVPDAHLRTADHDDRHGCFPDQAHASTAVASILPTTVSP
jgi:hypothetical protein